VSEESVMSWRAKYPVLVPEVASSGAIGVVRSLGRAGYPVHAVSEEPDAVGLHSRYAKARAVHPPYRSPEYLPWLRQYVRNEGIRAVIPSEGFWLAVRPRVDEFRDLCPDAPDLDVVYRCFSKSDVAERFEADPDPRLRADLPKTWVLRRGGTVPASLREWRAYPLYLKVDAVHTPSRFDGFIERMDVPEVLDRAVAAALEQAPVCIVQAAVPGRKACYNVLVRNSRILAETMCLASHENPHSGGLTSLRHIWWDDRIAADARRRLSALGWTGVAMVEYKYEAAGDRFWFLELNSRYWAALNLDLLADVDFPRLQVDSFFGRDIPPYTTTRRPLRSRLTFPADAGYMLSRVRDRQVPVRTKLCTLVEFLLLFLDPRVKSDMLFPRDRMLYGRFLGRFLIGLLRRRAVAAEPTH
jgi:hypothetical protein